jgi:hypothetical protein
VFVRNFLSPRYLSGTLSIYKYKYRFRCLSPVQYNSTPSISLVSGNGIYPLQHDTHIS